MKWKIFSLFTVLVLTLMACQAADETGRGMNNNNQNIDPVRNQTGDGMLQDRDYMMDRDAERYQNRGNADNRRDGTGDRSNYEVANEAAEKITDEVDEIDRAYVVTTENNAYVAATLDADNNNRTNNNNRDSHHNRNSDEITDEVEEKIAEIVRSTNRDIDHVYVSTNPDFLNLVTDYTRDVDRGQPVEGFFEQMGTMIERIFPQNR